jgi:hypothetical protein
MAVDKEIEKTYNDAKGAREKLESSPKNADGTRTVDGKKVSAAEFKSLVDAAKKVEKQAKIPYDKMRSEQGRAAEKAKSEAKLVADYLSQLRKLRDDNLYSISVLSNQIEKGFAQFPEQVQQDIDERNAKIVKIDSLLASSSVTPQFDEYGRAVVPETVPAMTETVDGMTGTQREGLRRRGQVAGGFGATPARAPTGPTGPTGPGDAGGGAGAGAGTKTPPTKLPANWENKFREMFPSQAWLLDIDRTKYPDVAALLKKGVINRSWETPESQARFVAEFNNTTFYKELATTGKVRAIKQLIGDAGFDSTPFNAFVTKAMNLGWAGDTLKFEAYREVFRKDDTGNLVNPTAVQRVQKSNAYLNIAGIGKAYFNQVSDDTVQKTLTGDMTVDDVQRQQREITKARYAHLSPLIDQGLSMDDIAASFRTQAAQLLEVDPNTIDMSRADYEVALNFGEEGKKRVMTNGEWQKLLRTDARYGWDKTENAKSEARRLANTISQAFGRVI